MKKILLIAILLLLPCAALAYEGFGDNVTGGAGYDNVVVSSLANSGAGTLRTALSGSNRNITFSVAGTISLSSSIEITGANITIDGFSAPDNGINITSSSDALIVSGNTDGADNTTGANIIIKGLRIRSTSGDGIQIAYNAHDVVVDHCSINDTGDGSVDVTEGAYNVTVSWSIVSNGAGNGPFLLTYNSNKVTLHHNIMYNNGDRNPIPSATHVTNYSTSPDYDEAYPIVDSRYNVIWEYCIGSYVMSESGVVGKANFVSNVYNYSGACNASNNIGRSSYDATARALAYIAGNVSVHDMRGQAYNYGAPANSIPDSAHDITTANGFNSEGTTSFPAPVITGPSLSNPSGHLTEWARVKDEAGVVASFTDDAVDAAVRAGVTIPADVFTYVWNSDATTADNVPTAFSFTNVTSAALSTETTTDPCITVAGIDAGQTPAVTISGTGCTYNVDGGAYTANAGTVGLDNVVCMKVTSGNVYYPQEGSVKSCTLAIGGVNNTGAPWTVRTLDAVSDPVAPRMRAGSMSGGWR